MARKSPPFKIVPSVGGQFRRDGKFVTAGRLSWCWECLVMSIASGVPGTHEIRRSNGKWYTIEMTIEEAEKALNPRNDFFGQRRINRARKFRANREARKDN